MYTFFKLLLLQANLMFYYIGLKNSEGGIYSHLKFSGI